MNSFQVLIQKIVSLLEKGLNVIIHCHAGLGRTGLVASCLLISLGYNYKEAIEKVRAIRRGSIPKVKQEIFIEKF
jgi:protein-tyrosine phosphatase